MLGLRRISALLLASAGLWCCHVYDSSLLTTSSPNGGSGGTSGASGGAGSSASGGADGGGSSGSGGASGSGGSAGSGGAAGSGGSSGSGGASGSAGNSGSGGASGSAGSSGSGGASGSAGSSGGTLLKVIASVPVSAARQDDLLLKVYVVTGGVEAGGAVVANGGWATPEFTMSPNSPGSVIVAGIYNATSATPITPAANNSTDDSGATADQNEAWWFGQYTGTVNGMILTLGGTDDNQWNAWCACEVMPAAGKTAAIDSSTQAALDVDASSITTAFFAAPSKAVLVALMMTETANAAAFSVSDSSGLTWTQRGIFDGGYTGVSAVFTATVP